MTAQNCRASPDENNVTHVYIHTSSETDKQINAANGPNGHVMTLPAGTTDELKHSIGMTSDDSFITAQDFYGKKRRYYLDPSSIPDERFEKVKMFNILNMVSEIPALNDQPGIPEDLLVYYDQIKLDFENKAQFIEEMVEGLEEYDIPIDVPVAEWIEKLNQKIANNTYRLTDATCDY